MCSLKPCRIRVVFSTFAVDGETEHTQPFVLFLASLVSRRAQRTVRNYRSVFPDFDTFRQAREKCRHQDAYDVV
jgi:hypothetical protein